MKKEYQNVGNRPIESADDSNIPVGVTIIFSKVNQCYRLVAENYKPILAKIEEKAYIVDAKDKKTLVEVVQKYITPLYQIALNNLTKTGENWLWFPNSPNELIDSAEIKYYTLRYESYSITLSVQITC